MRTVVTTFVAIFTASLVHAQTISAHPSAQFMPLRMFDAAGKLMAGVVAIPPTGPSYPKLAVTFRYQPSPAVTKGDSFTLRMQPDGSGPKLRYRWSSEGSDLFFFESIDCTGQPYVDVSMNSSPMPGQRRALLEYETNLLYLSEPDPTIVTRTYHSKRYPGGPCFVNAGPGSLQAIEVYPTVDFDDFFAPPFEVR